MHTNKYIKGQFLFLTFILILTVSQGKAGVLSASDKEVDCVLFDKNGQSIKFTGKAQYFIRGIEVLPYSMIVGDFVFQLSDKEKEKLSKVLDVSLKNIPSSMIVEDVTVDSIKYVTCNDITLKFNRLSVRCLDRILDFDILLLKITDTSNVSKELSKRFCRWLAVSSIGARYGEQFFIELDRMIKEEAEKRE